MKKLATGEPNPLLNKYSVNIYFIKVKWSRENKQIFLNLSLLSLCLLLEC